MDSIPSKTCFKCNSIKPLTEFYKHPQMADGRLNKCKECNKADSRSQYEKTNGNTDYERERFQRPERKAKVAQYSKARNIREPEKYKARYTLTNAIRDGKLIRQPCSVCGTTERVQAHHHDYSKPLDVQWLCFRHHREHEHGQTIRSDV